MVISTPPSDIPASQGQEAIAPTTKNPLMPTPVIFSSPLTPLNEVELSTPHEPQCHRSSLKDNNDFWDALDAFNNCLYDSDGNVPPESTEADSFHYEESNFERSPQYY